jgi:uncharacterized protein (DUF4415 family)
MIMNITSKSGRVFIRPTPEEDAQINAGIAADPDTYAFSSEDFKRLRPYRGRPVLEEKSVRISLRLAPNVAAHFKATGKGWQTRINAALAEYVAKHN